MSDTTTVRVTRSTRDHLNKISTARGETVDATIKRGSICWTASSGDGPQSWTPGAAGEDVEDQAELRAAMADLAGQ